jgi:hypothetical protein
MDNLNIHARFSFYKTFPQGEAFRLAGKLELHFSPKQGSWLDSAEVALSA